MNAMDKKRYLTCRRSPAMVYTLPNSPPIHNGRSVAHAPAYRLHPPGNRLVERPGTTARDAAPEIIKRLIDAQVATTPVQPAPAKPALTVEQEAAIALLDSWIAEGLAADPETKCQAEEELEEFKRNMNANRAATGDHPVYP
jgi:hypothetical protein